MDSQNYGVGIVERAPGSPQPNATSLPGPAREAKEIATSSVSTMRAAEGAVQAKLIDALMTECLQVR